MYSLREQTIKELYEFALNVPGKKTWRITRLAMYRALNNALASYDSPELKCLAISKSENLARDVLGLRTAEVVRADYPEHNMIDLKFSDASFDFCISDQVLEHVEGDPFKAFSESARVIKSGGFVCHTTCLLIDIHGFPKDFWRFTPEALSLLAKNAGLIPQTIGAWGNREIMSVMQSPLRFSQIPDDPKNPIYRLAMKNEADWPIVVWIIAQKP